MRLIKVGSGECRDETAACLWRNVDFNCSKTSPICVQKHSTKGIRFWKIVSEKRGRTSTRKATQLSRTMRLDGREKPAFRHSMRDGGGVRGFDADIPDDVGFSDIDVRDTEGVISLENLR